MPTKETYSVSGPDGWRHMMRAETMLDTRTLCGQDTRKGTWATHWSQPSCPDCLSARDAASGRRDE